MWHRITVTPQRSNVNMTTPHSDFRARRNEMIDLFKSFLFDSSDMSRSMFQFELIYMLVNVVTNILEDAGDPFKYFSLGMSKQIRFWDVSYLSILKKYCILELNERKTICR